MKMEHETKSYRRNLPKGERRVHFADSMGMDLVSIFLIDFLKLLQQNQHQHHQLKLQREQQHLNNQFNQQSNLKQQPAQQHQNEQLKSHPHAKLNGPKHQLHSNQQQQHQQQLQQHQPSSYLLIQQQELQLKQLKQHRLQNQQSQRESLHRDSSEQPLNNQKLLSKSASSLTHYQLQPQQQQQYTKSSQAAPLAAAQQQQQQQQQKIAQLPAAVACQFTQPISLISFRERVRINKVHLETCQVESRAGLISVSCTVRVLNLSYEKAVVVRYTTDDWYTHTDCPATYKAGSSDGWSDKFVCNFSLSDKVKRFRQGQRIMIAIQYVHGHEKTTCWDNNSGFNYTIQVLDAERANSNTTTTTSSSSSSPPSSSS